MTLPKEYNADEDNVADAGHTLDRDRVQRWVANWRAVNAAQDELVRSAPIPSPADCLEVALSLISVASRLRRTSPSPQRGDPLRAAEEEAVRRTWRKLRAAHGR